MWWFGRDAFSRAFDWAVSGVAAEKRSLAELKKRLRSAFEDSDPRAGERAAAEAFRDFGWAWPEFDQWLEQQRQQREGELAQRGLEEQLQALRTSELAALYANLLRRPAEGLRKAEMVVEMLQDLPENTQTMLAQRLRQRILKQPAMEERFRAESMGRLLHLRVLMKAYALRDEAVRKKQIKDRPWWRFTAPEDPATPADCYALNGTVKRYDDAFWSGRDVPCERLDCRCSIASLNERESLPYRFRQGDVNLQRNQR